jgi:hypothetical protein
MDNNPFVPTDLNVSKLRFYSIGLVAQNKPLNTDVIDVTPIEELNMLEGEISANQTDIKATGKDGNDKTYSTSVKSTVTIKASWLPFGNSNRISSPDVRRGESVMIYQFGDADKYYWVTLKQDNHLRRLETTIFAFSATSKEVEKLDASNSYFLEVSTHRKIVTFHTSTANGEPFSYDIQIDAGKGSVTVTDNVGNTILLDSKQSRVLLKNSSGTSFDLNKKSILAIAPTSFQIITDVFNVVAKST